MSLQSLTAALNEKFGPDGVKNAFYLIQIALGVLFIGVLSRLRGGSISSNSGFGVREAELKKAREAKEANDAAAVAAGLSPSRSAANTRAHDLANARMDLKVPLSLSGIRIDGPPHEVLGVAVGASEGEIQKAYRERMKQYHPDKVGRPGSREWTDAQKIAEAINAAKNELLKRSQARK